MTDECVEVGQAVIYRGPYSEVCDDDGHVFPRGKRMAVCQRTFDFVQNNAFISKYSMDRRIGRYDTYRPYYGRQSKVYDEFGNYYLTKYYPSNIVARKGMIAKNDKVGEWKFYHLDSSLNYTVNYFDSTITLNDSIEFDIYGELIDYTNDSIVSKKYIIELNSKYDCANSDHFEVRQYYLPDESKENKDELLNIAFDNFISLLTPHLESEFKKYTYTLNPNTWKFDVLKMDSSKNNKA